MFTARCVLHVETKPCSLSCPKHSCSHTTPKALCSPPCTAATTVPALSDVQMIVFPLWLLLLLRRKAECLCRQSILCVLLAQVYCGLLKTAEEYNSDHPRRSLQSSAVPCPQISRYVPLTDRGPGSSVGIATELRAGRSGIESRWGRDFPPVQTGLGAHPASCKMGTGSFLGVKYGRGVLLTTPPLLVPQSWKSRAIPLPTLWATPGL